MHRRWIAWVCAAVLSAGAFAQDISPLAEARRTLALKDFTAARRMFSGYLANHPGDIPAQMGIADAELGLHHYLSAEAGYRRVVAAQPQLWIAHKNLVIVEAALGRWEDFDRERLVLRGARERNAPGISRDDIDVIESLDLHGEHWIVRDYFLPSGRTRARYNFERFSPGGRVEAYVSLEAANALHEELKSGAAVVIGAAPRPTPELTGFALDFYDGKSHGTVATYAAEPTYERVRADFLRWQRSRSAR